MAALSSGGVWLVVLVAVGVVVVLALAGGVAVAVLAKISVSRERQVAVRVRVRAAAWLWIEIEAETGQSRAVKASRRGRDDLTGTPRWYPSSGRLRLRCTATSGGPRSAGSRSHGATTVIVGRAFSLCAAG